MCVDGPFIKPHDNFYHPMTIAAIIRLFLHNTQLDEYFLDWLYMQWGITYSQSTGFDKGTINTHVFLKLSIKIVQQ